MRVVGMKLEFGCLGGRIVAKQRLTGFGERDRG